MKLGFLIACALLAVTSAPASAVGLELAWNACYVQPGAVGSIKSTCDANTGSQNLFASFRPPAIAKLEGIEVLVDFQLARLPVAADAQQYGCGFRILNGGTMPLGTCDGCTANLCFVLNSITLTSSTGIPGVVLQTTHPGSESWASWRPLATPTLQHTWGQIKGLYR